MTRDEYAAALRPLILEIDGYRPRLPTGWMERTIREAGVYEEDGLRITMDDGMLGPVYVGMAVLSRDIHGFIAEPGQKPVGLDAALFELIVADAKRGDARYGQRAFPHYEGLPADQVAALPTGLAAAAMRGEPTVAGLGSPDIVHEWTFKPGKRLFLSAVKHLGTACRDFVCKDIHGSLESGALQDKALGIALGSLLAGGFGASALWIPLAAYIGLGVARRGLDKYCTLDADESEKLIIPTSW